MGDLVPGFFGGTGFVRGAKKGIRGVARLPRCTGGTAFLFSHVQS
jgi:hypothetical protein